MSSPDHHWRVKPFLAPWALQHVLRWENVKKKSTKVFHLTLAFPSSSRSLFLPSWIFLPTSLTSSYPPLGPSFLQVWKVGFREVWSSLLIFLFLFFRDTGRKGLTPLPPPPPHAEGGAGWGFSLAASSFAHLPPLPPPTPLRLLSRRASWGSRRCWLSWWRCHQSRMGVWGLGRGQSKCQESEREGPWAGQGGNWGAPPIVFLLLLLNSQLASSAAAGVSHPGGILVREPASPYQEGWPEKERRRRKRWGSDLSAAQWIIQEGGAEELCTCSLSY